MHTITTQLTDGVYEKIAREAARRSVSIDEIIDEWLLEGENSDPSPSPEESAAFFENEEHHVAERCALSEWHESLAKQLRA